MAALIRAPHECLSFYAATQAGHPPLGVQIDAMMIALAQHLPTVNGWSGLFPPGWNFYDTNAGDYEQRATRWAVKRGFVGNLCQVNVESGTWTLATQSRDLICASRSRGGPALRDRMAAWLRWILGSITPPISPRLPA